MPIIKSIREFNWDLSWKGFMGMLHSIRLYFTNENKLGKWVYLYTFILVPLLNFMILGIRRESLISIGSIYFPRWIFSQLNVILMSILIVVTIFIFIISLLTFNKVKPLLFASMFTQIIVLFFETNIIRRYELYYPDIEHLRYLFTILCSVSLLFVIIQLLKIAYVRIRASIISRRELKY